jgi:hypothetical protein
MVSDICGLDWSMTIVISPCLPAWISDVKFSGMMIPPLISLFCNLILMSLKSDAELGHERGPEGSCVVVHQCDRCIFYRIACGEDETDHHHHEQGHEHQHDESEFASAEL